MANVEAVIKGLRNRAEHSRRVYNISVVAMLAVTVSLVALYLFGASITMSTTSSGPESLTLLFVFGGVIVRVGAVAIGIYAVQIIFNLARYHIRVAHHLEASADAVELCGEGILRLEQIQRVLVPAAIDFGKAPASPSDKVFEILKEMANKIPGQTKP